MLDQLRQWRYPREFRIAAPAWPAGLTETLLALAAAPAAGSPVDGPPARSAPSTAAHAVPGAVLADVATGLWRLRGRLVEPGTDRPRDEHRRLFRDLQSVWDALTGSGLEIQAHTEAPFDAGQALQVLAYQPTPGLSRPQVIETVRPSVYWQGQAIQMGEVIVGTPAEPTDAATGGAAPATEQ